MSSWPGQPLATGGAGALPLQPSSPRHYVLPPPATAPQAPEQLVPVPETGLVDVMLCSHRQAFILFDHAVKVRGRPWHKVAVVVEALWVHLLVEPRSRNDMQVKERVHCTPVVPAGRGAGQHAHHGARVWQSRSGPPSACTGACGGAASCCSNLHWPCLLA